MTASFPVTMSNDFKVEVATTNNRGFTPEEVAQRCVSKIVGISETAPPAIREQAKEYRDAVEKTGVVGASESEPPKIRILKVSVSVCACSNSTGVTNNRRKNSANLMIIEAGRLPC